MKLPWSIFFGLCAIASGLAALGVHIDVTFFGFPRDADHLQNFTIVYGAMSLLLLTTAVCFLVSAGVGYGLAIAQFVFLFGYGLWHFLEGLRSDRGTFDVSFGVAGVLVLILVAQIRANKPNKE